MEEENRVCNDCGILQPIDNFKLCKGANKLGFRYRHRRCGACLKKYMREFYLKNRKNHLIECKKYYDHNREKKLNYQKEYFNKNKEKVRIYKKGYRASHREKISLDQKKRYENDKEKFLSHNRKYKKENREKLNKYIKEKRLTDINYKISQSLRSSLSMSIHKNWKKSSALVLLGCSVEEFKRYIENQFHPGMNWSLWGHGKGRFHLDHIKPVALFNLTDYEQQKICFHYTNFRPLWSHENFSKSDWIEHEGQKVRARDLKSLNNVN